MSSEHPGELEHLRRLPDGTLTRAEVGILLDTINRTEQRLDTYVDHVETLLVGWEAFLDSDNTDDMAAAIRAVMTSIEAGE